MADPPVQRAGSWFRRATDKAKHMGGTLRDEYRKGVVGDNSPVAQLGPAATERLQALLTRPRPRPASAAAPVADCEPSEPDVEVDTDETAATDVDQMLRRVDWGQVSTALRDHAAVQRMRDVAAQVDWGAARPAAARVGASLIAATAAGQLGGLGGRTGTLVARTIINETGLAERVAALGQRPGAPGPGDGINPPFAYVDTTATEGAPSSFDDRLAELRRALPPARAADGAQS